MYYSIDNYEFDIIYEILNKIFKYIQIQIIFLSILHPVPIYNTETHYLKYTLYISLNRTA